MRPFVKAWVALAAIVIAALALGCKEQSTTILNKETTIYFGGSQIEATVRELTVDGGQTSVRVRFVNISGSPLEELKAHVDFVDADGAVLVSDEIELSFHEPLTVGDSVSGTASCKSNERIVGVVLSSAGTIG